MRLPNRIHESHPWRIAEIAGDFELEDVWALPAHGGAEDFGTLIEVMMSLDPAAAASLPARLLWQARDQLGRWFDLGRISAEPDRAGADAGEPLPIPGTNETSLADRLCPDLRHTVTDLGAGFTPFVPLFRTEREFAAELSNRTVHAIMHLAWVDRAGGRYQGQLAVYVKRRGALGMAYMAAIRPLRHGIVYPALMREIERAWASRAGDAASRVVEAV